MRWGTSGDLMLFESHCAGGMIIRKAISGNVDHVGVLIGTLHELGLLESLAFCGAKMWNWDDFTKQEWRVQYSRVLWRPLFVTGSKLAEVDAKLKEFKDYANSGTHAYELDVADITGMVSMRSGDTVDDKTFFCSELVAKAYKEAGLLREDVASCAYFPSCFEEQSNLSLFGAELGPEILVVFDEEEVE